MKEEMEEEERKIDDQVEGDIRTITKGTFERKKKTLYSGKVLRTDWVENVKKRRQEKEKLKKPKPVSKIEYDNKMNILGERRIVDEVILGSRKYVVFGPKSRTEKGRILQRQQYVIKERTMTTDCDGKVTYSPWKMGSEEIGDVEIIRY